MKIVRRTREREASEPSELEQLHEVLVAQDQMLAERKAMIEQLLSTHEQLREVIVEQEKLLEQRKAALQELVSYKATAKQMEEDIKKQEEKEEAKRVREELREQQKLEQEIRAAREKIAKERKHFTVALRDLQARLEKTTSDEDRMPLLAKIAEIEMGKANLDSEEKVIDYRTRAVDPDTGEERPVVVKNLPVRECPKCGERILDGKAVAAGTGDQTVRLFDPATRPDP